ncbi:MAG TPA: maltose alpha-D-glucosyltransferase [Acidimicrobiales bacterium]|nr:maltose alpha-D-glucosyltransferase [Acidimicrobiales bacterium]
MRPASRASASAVLGDVEHWYKDAVIYELHVRAFQDSDADGIGDFRGLITRLDYLQDLGVTAVWLLPFYPSPLRDDGYDISDYRHIHPSYGTLRDFRMFLREAHLRGLRVITELVLAHTSDEHPWFERARRAPVGSEHRDYYIWSDTPDRFTDARVIFKDFESSNWSYDPVAHAYFWHRFYAHQPSLNYDSPVVQREITDVVDYWLEMGVDGLRLDAVPYLYAREGTTCENLPETLEFLRRLRAHIDERFQGRMLLAEANQWPEDAVAYMGDGDMCHMAFHFPLMPRMFMAARQEDRFPIVDILAETPSVPADCQWALFLRNHDELTLEMVTDEERDYMYRVYAQDPRARVNVGIRRRLAPLLGNDRTLIEMMNGLLFSLPGTPIIYYGDEIGMGDNIYLGDRNGVRTPMQWGSDRNAGFSRANPQRLYLPVIIDPGYHANAVNVEAQQENPSSLLWWMQRLVALRSRYRAFSRGSLEMLFPDNRKVLAFLRCYQDEKILVVVNLSRYAQGVELDLSDFRGATPVELFGATEFPNVGDLPYFVTLGPHGFYWFSLEAEPGAEPKPRSALTVNGTWDAVFASSALLKLEDLLPAYLSERRWFASKSTRIKSVELFEAAPIYRSGTVDPASATTPPEPGTPARSRGSRSGAGDVLAILAMLGVELSDGTMSTYVLPMAFVTGQRAEELDRNHPEAVIANLRVVPMQAEDAVDGILYDAVWSEDFSTALLDAVVRRRQIRAHAGRLVGLPAPPLRRMTSQLDGSAPAPMSAEQSNTSIVYGNALIAKVLRRVEGGVNPAVEMGRFLTERARFAHSPAVGGSVEYRPFGAGSPTFTVATLEEFVPNEGDGWSFVVDSLGRGLEELLAAVDPAELAPLPPARLLDLAVAPFDDTASAPGDEDDPVQVLVGPHVEWSTLLGRRTAELHLALASDKEDPVFSPAPLTAIDRQAMFHGARGLAKRSFRSARPLAGRSPELRAVLEREDDVVERLQVIVNTRISTSLIRCHGDYHLGQVLWTGKDFVIVDFEGEPARSISQRRLKRPALADVAGMVRSFHYASQGAARQVGRSLASSRDPSELEPWLTVWFRAVAGTFLRGYLEAASGSAFVPESREELATLLDFLVLEKAVYELGYEANSRPDWLAIPAKGILDLLEAPS